MFKRNNPGCNNSTNCRCSGGGGDGPCEGCSSTQLLVTITNSTTPIQILPVHFSPGPCNWLYMGGFDAIDGSYYVEWPDPVTNTSYIELGRWASTDNPEVDSTSVGWCVYLRVGLLIETVSGGGDGCTARIVIGYAVTSDFSAPYTCAAVEDMSFSNDSDTVSSSFAFCTASTGSASLEIFAGNADCAAQEFSLDWEVSPV